MEWNGMELLLLLLLSVQKSEGEEAQRHACSLPAFQVTMQNG
jgi:hypothetical protein